MVMVFRSLLCMMALVTAEAQECALYVTPTMKNPAGTVTCASDGQAGSSKGKDCLKLQGSGVTGQMCDGSSGQFLCEVYGSPTTCCDIGGVGKIICSGGKGFTAAPSEDEFKDCTAKCKVGGGGGGGSTDGSIGTSMSAAALLVAVGGLLGFQ